MCAIHMVTFALAYSAAFFSRARPVKRVAAAFWKLIFEIRLQLFLRIRKINKINKYGFRSKRVIYLQIFAVFTFGIKLLISNFVEKQNSVLHFIFYITILPKKRLMQQ